MTPQQRLRQAFAEYGKELVPAEIDSLMRIMYVVLGRTLAANGREWNEEKVVNILISRLREKTC